MKFMVETGNHQCGMNLTLYAYDIDNVSPYYVSEP